MKILVTGATGFIGRVVVSRLIERGEQVTVLLRHEADRAFLPVKGINVSVGSVTDRASVVRALRGVESVIHLAAWVSLYSRRMSDMRQVNVTGVENVGTAALEAGVRRLIHVSSIVAVGASGDGTPVNEATPWTFSGVKVPYVVTKREGEEAALRYRRPDLDVVVVNPCLTVGAPDMRQKDPGGIIRYVKRKRRFVTPGGANYVDVCDVADGIVGALLRGRSGERYILGGENLLHEEYFALLEQLTGVEPPNWHPAQKTLTRMGSVFDRLERWSGVSMPLNSQLMWLGGQKWFADPSKARAELLMPHTPIHVSLTRALDYYRERKWI